MKTLTELSGTQIRMAAAAVAQAKRSLPKEEKPSEPVAAEAPQAEATETTEAVAAPAAPVAPKAPAPEAESEAVKAALDAAVANATGLSGDRLAMLRAAVEVVGRRAEDVRLVRVFGAEEPVSGAKVHGGHQYVVDFFPQSMKQVAGVQKEEGRRGGRGGGRGGGGGGGRGSGGTKAGATGGFSMDSLREDRRNERGGGRGRPGGGGGRRPAGGGAPSGGPKK